MVFLSDEKFDKNNISDDEIVKGIVDELMAEKLMDNPFDFLFRSSSDYLPRACHEVLQLPGIFEEKLNPNVFSFTGRSLEADYIEKVEPDNKEIFDPAIIVLDHMSYKLDPDKINSSFEYKMSKIMKSKALCFIYIVTNIDYSDEILIKMSHYDHFSIRIIHFDKEKIYKMLNTLTQKDYTKHVFNDEDLIRFVYCLIFSKKPFAKDVIEQLVDLFVSVKNISFEYMLYLHLALKTMIKKHIGDKKEIRRLLTMITQKANTNDIKEISLSMSYEERISILKENRNILNNLLAEKELEIVENNNEIIEKDRFIDEMSKSLSEKDKALNEKDDEIKKLKQHIELLENGSS